LAPQFTVDRCKGNGIGCWPGNTADSALIRQVKQDMRAWSLARVVWVADRGFASAANRRFLQQGGGHYILGEKLRGGTPAADAALSRQGRYQTVRDNLQVKEVRSGPDLADDRFVVCYHPAEAERDAATRARHVQALTELICGTDSLPRSRRDELAGVISTKPHLKRYLRRTPGGLLRVDQAAVARETNLDGKYLLRTSDPTLSTEDIALGYKQLLEVERGWRTMKQVIDLRPVYHRKEDQTASAPTSPCAGWPCCSSVSRRPPPHAPGPPSAMSCSACRRSPTPARPAPSGRPPR
jgi:hypothetical protein